jgi:hypothetical protein
MQSAVARAASTAACVHVLPAGKTAEMQDSNCPTVAEQFPGSRATHVARDPTGP